MKLYHGSPNGNLLSLKRMQAEASESVEVPEDELKYGIYLTPHYEYALAMAIRTHGLTFINDDKTIEFENPELFNPNEDVYVYEVEVSEEFAQQIDKDQFVVESLEEITPTCKYTHKAGEIEQYYELKT
ncbi:TPA: hypothetical protein DEP58_05220 [Patescibacteria group bacterium]|nr:MAG: hypothetical protein UU98_C0012G0025 [Parcubacteria group bacterium GW2011_GWD2_42_14]HCC05667.1 hypothetical protein [Patescibacteria group bacterium]